MSLESSDSGMIFFQAISVCELLSFVATETLQEQASCGRETQ